MDQLSVTEGIEPASGFGGSDGPPAVSVRVNTPESPIHEPRRFLEESLREMRVARVLGWRLAVRDISAQYRQTFLGYVWAVAPAIFTMLVWVVLNGSQIVNVKTGSAVSYPAFVLVGTLFWQVLVEALNAPLKQLSVNRSMLNRVNFPPEALLISGILQVLFSLAIKIAVLAVALAILQAPVQPTALLVVFPLFGLLLIGTVVGVLIVPAGLLYQDVSQAVPIILMPLMFVTPVVYPSTAPVGFISTLMRVNPLTAFFETVRDFLFGGVGPYLVEAAVVSGVTVLLAVLGWIVYRISLPVLVERLDA